MELIHDIEHFRSIRRGFSPSASLGFVPTMGALHQGHASLIRQAVAQNDKVVVSIFVNPTQFGANEDLSNYPRTLEADCKLIENLGAAFVFAPSPTTIYPHPQTEILFALREMDKKLCGRSRPGHFDGVIQVVTILFHIVQPNRAYFGLKDYQQFQVIQRMIEELHFPIELVGCPIVREDDGLALSSRNVYLSAPERKQSLFLYKTLTAIQQQIEDFQTVDHVKAFVHQSLAQYPLVNLDYFEIFHDKHLTEVDSLTPSAFPRAFMAAFVGNTRLIDNMALY